MAVPVRVPRGPLYLDIDGFRVATCYTVERFREALKYEPVPDDRFVATFPKAGTTWTQQIGYLIFHEGVPPSAAQDFHDSGPFIDMFGADAVKKWTRLGFVKTHLPYNLAPKSARAKYLYLCRNPKDTCVSFFSHTTRFPCYAFEDGTFEEFFEVFMNEETDNGDYFDHVLSWYEHRDDFNVLFINYEDMKAEPNKFVLDIADIMDKDRHQLLLQNRRMLENIVKYSDITFMKGKAKDVFENLFARPSRDTAAHFVRKGTVGDWKGYFSAEMNERMEEKIFRKLSQTDLIDVWKKYGII
ncbi:unnamed protein product [Ixodes hexagonus]